MSATKQMRGTTRRPSRDPLDPHAVREAIGCGLLMALAGLLYWLVLLVKS